MEYRVTRDDSYLEHHGILGMKWGVRKREDPVGNHRSASPQTSPKPKAINQNSAEVRQKANIRRNELIKEYTKNGMSPQKAREAANRKLALEKAAIFGLSAAAIAGIGIYAAKGGDAKKIFSMVTNVGETVAKDATKITANKKPALTVLEKIGQESVSSPKVKKLAVSSKPFVDDIVLDMKDVPLHRIATTSDKAALTAHEAFYASFDDIDNQKYLGGYGAQLKAAGAGKIYEMLISPKSPIKVAGRTTATEEFGKLLQNNAEFRKNFEAVNSQYADNGFLNLILPERGSLHSTVQTALKQGADFSDPKNRDAAYDAFNICLCNHNAEGNAMAKEFYKTLRSKGYHAIEDVNDQMYSGYKSKHPLIIFNPKDTVGGTKTRSIELSEVQRAQAWFMKQIQQGA